MYINLKSGVLKITLREITFKTWKELDKIKQARRNSGNWKPCKHLF